MLRLLLLCLTLVFSLPLAAAHACDKIADATADSDCVYGVKWHGREGGWFEASMVQDILFKSRAFPQLTLQVDQYRFAQTLHEKETASLRSAVERLQSANSHLRQQSELAAADARGARAELAAEHRWYKSPLFWGIVMFVAGAAVQHACCGPGK